MVLNIPVQDEHEILRWIRVDQGVIAVKEYFSFCSAPKLDLYHQTQFTVITRYSFSFKVLLFLCRGKGRCIRTLATDQNTKRVRHLAFSNMHILQKRSRLSPYLPKQKWAMNERLILNYSVGVQHTPTFLKLHLLIGGIPLGLMAKVLDYGSAESVFEFQLRFYFHFRINTLGKGIEPSYPTSHAFNAITTLLLQRWLRQ